MLQVPRGGNHDYGRFPLSAILLGLINIIITVAVLLLVGAIIQWVMTLVGFGPPDIVVKLFLVSSR